MSERRPMSPVLSIAVTLAVLLGIYLGAYYTIVKPIMGEAHYADHRKYSFGDFMEADNRWRRFFAPIHWVDRKLRPNVWGPKELPP